MQSTQGFAMHKIDTSSFSLPSERRLLLGLEEFLAMWEQLGVKNKFVAKEKFAKSSLAFAEGQDAYIVVGLHDKAYEGMFPYHEMLDPEYVEKFVSDRNNNLVGLYSHEDNLPGGCGIMNCHPKDRTGYLRGLIVIPEYQGKIDMKKCMSENAALGYQHFWNTVDRCYTETRTAHSKAQFLVEYISLRPCGILPNKDMFVGNGKRESDVLQISYPNRTLYEKRNDNPILLPELRPLYDFIADQFSLPDTDFQKADVEVTTAYRTWARKLSEEVQIRKWEDCFNVVFRRFSYGINYFDVAPSYGNAELMLGPALEPYRKNIFLACKTGERKKEGSRKELEQSLRNLETDYFDLYQLHAVTNLKDVDTIFSNDGAMRTFLEAREEGKVRFLGFSAHSVEAALELMSRFNFDTILFPFNYATWYAGNFGPMVMEKAKEKNMGILALKAMARRPWQKGEAKTISKTWYEPLTDPEDARKALRFTLSHPVTAAIPPGDENLFSLALKLALDFKPLDSEEIKEIKMMGLNTEPLFRYPMEG